MTAPRQLSQGPKGIPAWITIIGKRVLVPRFPLRSLLGYDPKKLRFLLHRLNAAPPFWFPTGRMAYFLWENNRSVPSVPLYESMMLAGNLPWQKTSCAGFIIEWR